MYKGFLTGLLSCMWLVMPQALHVTDSTTLKLKAALIGASCPAAILRLSYSTPSTSTGSCIPPARPDTDGLNTSTCMHHRYGHRMQGQKGYQRIAHRLRTQPHCQPARCAEAMRLLPDACAVSEPLQNAAPRRPQIAERGPPVRTPSRPLQRRKKSSSIITVQLSLATEGFAGQESTHAAAS